MVLIVTLVRFPGVGCPQPLATRTESKGQHNALAQLQTQMQAVAREQGYDWSKQYPSLGTLRKDLERLRDYGILEQRMYRWGYYLGTGVMTVRELQAALNSLESQGKYQGDPEIRRIYQSILQRLRGFPFPTQGSKNQPYPVRQNINRAINYTDPDEMREKQQYRDTLFHCVPLLEEVIVGGKGKGQDYLDYRVVLPRRSLDEFSIWVQRYADKAQVLSPPVLVEKHQQMALRLLEHYPFAQSVSSSP
ncbi:WYL domain-containing protein [Spirulina subsalsa FACHB-351]|uniref:WYL domain-containing protein n=2 Tax=Spirulina subsalsa TaxID=54311 RepID=A0ABT3L8J5_9CYAN|nr:WYL domain-containing protein [Spirulina subsalsa FACHB-351]